MLAVLSLTIIDQFQTAEHNSPALSMNPYDLHVECSNEPEIFNFFGKNKKIEKIKNFTKFEKIENSDRYMKMINECKYMQTEENEGGYLDSRNWKVLDINRKTDSRGRIYAGETYYGKDIRVFVSDINRYPEICKHYILLPSNIYTEVTKSRKKGELGDPLKVQKNGDIWTTIKNKDKYVFVFVRK
jgi:hypothetical protein